MYLLYAANSPELSERSRLFSEFMEPLLQRLEAATRAGHIPGELTQVPEYLHVCRLPFRRLEYSFALDALSAIGPGDMFLDAGSGVTPLAHIFARRGAASFACDANQREIQLLQQIDWKQVYGEVKTPVTYATQDLTALDYPDAMFDAVACISVLEHIPAPGDQRALRELVRVLKPNGVLVLTVDFKPRDPTPRSARARYYWKRLLKLLQYGNLGAIQQGAARKVQAQLVVQQGGARHARSANQCFERAHLVDDILPILKGTDVPSHIPFENDWNAYTTSDAKRFWRMDNGKALSDDPRDVLPAALVWKKS